MEAITIRRAEASMLDEMAALEQLCFTDPWSRDSLSDAIASPIGLWLCVYSGDTLIATFGAQVIRPEAEIMSIGVHPSYRRRGIARALLTAFFAKADGIDSVYLEVRSSNLPAQTLYTALGFVPCGVRRSYYEHPTEDAILMMWTRPGEELC